MPAKKKVTDDPMPTTLPEGKELYFRARVDALSLSHKQYSMGDLVPCNDLEERQRNGLLRVIEATGNNYRVCEFGTLDAAGRFIPFKTPDVELVRPADEVKEYSPEAQKLFNPEPAPEG